MRNRGSCPAPGRINMMSLARSALALTLTVLIAHFGLPARAQAAELRVGAATVSITPDRPVSLAGQMNTRISQAVESPVVAAALAMESREGEKVMDQAILVSLDLVLIADGVVEPVRKKLAEKI